MAIELRLHEADAGVRIDDAGVRHLIVTDPRSGITIHIPMPEEAAKQMAEMLIGSPIVVAPASALSTNLH